MNLFEYRGQQFPSYLRDGNAMRWVQPFADQFCRGAGLDVGCGDWCLPGALGIDIQIKGGCEALRLPPRTGGWDYIFSSHCMEHLDDPIEALDHWRERLRPGGTLMLYLPHPDMTYWRPQNCRKHRHIWLPIDMAGILGDLGFVGVIHSERDLAWSFAVVARKPEDG